MKKSKLIIGTALSLGLLSSPLYSNVSVDKTAFAVQSNDYENIYNRYVDKVHEKAKVLVKEYLEEVKPNASTEEKAELAVKKIFDLAEVTTEGVFEMALVSGDPVADLEEGSLYNQWSTKLLNYYENEGDKIFDAYLNEAMNNNGIIDDNTNINSSSDTPSTNPNDISTANANKISNEDKTNVAPKSENKKSKVENKKVNNMKTSTKALPKTSAVK